jgi:malate dehydrogenase
MVIGEHGEHMIPYPQLSNVDGINLTSMLSPEEIEEVVENTKSGGAQIVKYLKTSAYYAPGRAIAIMVEAILENRDIVVPSSVILEGEYGYEDISIGVPIVLGNSGAKVIIDMGLDENIKAKFDLAVKSIKDNIAILERENFFD